MRRKIPSTMALQAFEAAARHQSYTKAADELAVTQSAVCRQIAALETFLGLRLFRRSHRGVALTDAGLQYSRQVTTRLDEVERDTLDLMSRGGRGGSLELGVVPTFATRWLLPRLPDFARRHPDIHINLASRPRPFLFEDSGLDAALYAGERIWPGTEGLFLMQEHLVAVASPALLGRRRSLSDDDWPRHTLLQQSTRPYAWRQWFESRGLQVDNDMSGPRLELFSMVAEAATHGMGVGLLPRFLVEDELARGQLVQVSDHVQPDQRRYYLVHPEGKADDAVLAVFRDWLDAQARAYRQDHPGQDHPGQDHPDQDHRN